MLSVGVWSLAPSPLAPSPPSLTATGSPAPSTLVPAGFFVNGDSLLSASPPFGSATLSDNLVASSTTSSSSSTTSSSKSYWMTLLPFLVRPCPCPLVRPCPFLRRRLCLHLKVVFQIQL